MSSGTFHQLACPYARKCEHRSSHVVLGSSLQAKLLNGMNRSMQPQLTMMALVHQQQLPKRLRDEQLLVTSQRYP